MTLKREAAYAKMGGMVSTVNRDVLSAGMETIVSSNAIACMTALVTNSLESAHVPVVGTEALVVNLACPELTVTTVKKIAYQEALKVKPATT